MASNVKERVLKLLAPIAQQMEIYLVDVENARMGKSRLLRIYVDCEGGIDMNRCEAFHRAITDVLEEIDYDYLEVSSPGDRPLKSDMDFIRLTGREVEVHLYAARDGKKKFEGVLLGRADGIIHIEANEEELSFDQKDVSAVRPLFRIDFD